MTFVAPWDEFVQALQPAFAMDEQKALSSVLPSTQDVTEKFLDAFQARLRVAPPRSSETRTDTLAQAGAERTEKTTTELKTEPGDVSSVSEAPSAVAGRKAADLPGRDVSAEPLAVDPMLQHSAALALFQEVALLNATVRRAALRYGYVPYVVRLQISLMPFARDLPYDAYSTVSFFSGAHPTADPARVKAARDADGCERVGEDALPYVIPLLVTDNLETSLHSRTDDVVRQLNLGLSLLLQGFGAAADVQRLNEGLRGVVGRDYASVQTIGRLSDNTLRVRLGAASQVDVRYAMTPRTHNVTLVLLAPGGLLASDVKPTVRLAARTTLLDVETGEALRARTDKQVDVLLYQAMKGNGAAPEGRSQKEVVKKARNLLSSVQRADWNAYLEEGSSDSWEMPYPESLWADLQHALIGSQRSSASFDLPRPDPLEIAPQSALLLDDTEEHVTVSLAGVRGVVAERTQATLGFESGGKSYSLPARQIRREGGRLELRFPSLALWSLEPTDASLELSVRSEPDPWRCVPHGGGPSRTWKAAGVRYRKRPPKPAPADPGFKLSVAARGIVPKAGAGAVDVYVDIGESETKGAKTPTADKVEVAVEGGDFALQSVDPAAAATRPTATNRIEVVKDCRLALSFSNLTPGQRIVLSSKNVGTKVKHADVEVPVLPPPAGGD